MTLPNGAWDNADLVPEFHKDFFKNHWDKSEGIFVRSRDTLETLKQHFRKFTQIKDSNSTLYFFRFWDEAILNTLIKTSVVDQTSVKSFFKNCEIIYPSTKNLSPVVIVVKEKQEVTNVSIV
jgi:uncharacterized protein (DUF1697 family)